MNDSTNASRESSIALETEPLVFFHPTLAGASPPGAVQPVGGTVLLEEEPSIWPQLDLSAGTSDSAYGPRV